MCANLAYRIPSGLVVRAGQYSLTKGTMFCLVFQKKDEIESELDTSFVHT